MGQVKKYVNAEAWGAESTIYYTLDEHANPYTTDARETSGRSQLRLIETLYSDPSDVTLPKFSK
jgi:hypothetical protein